MFRDNTQTVMIVKSSGKEAQFAQLLFQLISKLPGFESSQPVMESEYKSTYATIDNIPKGKMIFFGNGKEAEAQGKFVNWQYDCYGMKYGWLGNRCVIAAEPDEVSLKEQSAFADYYNSRIEQFKPLIDLQRIFYSETETVNTDEIDDTIRWEDTDNISGKAAKTMTTVLLSPLILLAKGLEGVSNTYENTVAAFERKSLWKRQYELLVCEFILNGFERFMNNISDKVAKDQMILVYDVKNAEYAHLLHNLIQQYSGYDVVEFTEKMFTDNAKSLSSRNKIIFLGKSKSAKERSAGLNYIFDQYNMRFGWIGNHAFIDTDKLKPSLRESFIAMYAQKSKDYEDKASDYAKRGDSQIGRKAATVMNVLSAPRLLLFGLPGLVLEAGVRYGTGIGVDKIINSANTVADLSGYQYQLVLREFVFSGLYKFMEA